MNNFEIFGVPSLSKGSGIRIKEENKGKFTDYCGGKVTDECILRGKNSSNPTTRKRATFADNARHFKHEDGAKIHKPNGHRSILDNNWIPTKELKKKHKLVGYNLEGGSVYPDWMIPDKFYDVDYVEEIMRRNSQGNFKNLFGGMKNINSGSRIVGSWTMGNLGFRLRPTPNNSRDLISQYLYGTSSLTPYKNPTPIIVDGLELTGDQYEGKIFLQDSMRLPQHMKDIVEDYINNKRLISMTSNDPTANSWYEYYNQGKTYDNTRAHYISFKKDENGNLYADIFDRWDFDHNRLGRTLEKIHGNPFILRQRVPIEFIDYYDVNTMSYLLNMHKNNRDFKEALNKDYNLNKLDRNYIDWKEYYGY